ncbi:MAG: hypothetical protein NWF06_00890 [Candidatus Bathyarchaeota archaeon]|nr:hypothetical protein [Candidatus Bathyarchaeum sp.]
MLRLFGKAESLTAKEAKNFYNQLLKHGSPEKAAKNIVKFYKG